MMQFSDIAIASHDKTNKLAKTQKARGLVALREASNSLPHVEVPAFLVCRTETDIDRWTFSGDDFARPCPPAAVHGFVESRKVETVEEARVVFHEALAEDPASEMILMARVDASFNAVVTPGLITIGPGHDGATGGNDAVSVGCANQTIATDSMAFKAVCQKAGITAAPYMELVTERHSGQVILTQLRNGPDVGNQGANYQPWPAFVVAEVVEPNGEDLLEWKKRCEKFGKQTVVWHEDGSLTSHYGIHCYENGIPYFTTGTAPEVGDCLQMEHAKEELSLNAILEGIAIGMTCDIEYASAVHVCLAALHNRPYLKGSDGKLLGVGAMLGVRLGMTAAFGEARHKVFDHKPERTQVYAAVWSTVAEMVQSFNDARGTFYQKGWSGSFGGKKWAECSDATVDLWNEMLRFIRDPAQERLSTIVSLLNEMVNKAHNNGWWFNKFVDSTVFDLAAKHPIQMILRRLPKVYDLMRAEPDMTAVLEARLNTNETIRRNLKAGSLSCVDGIWVFGDTQYESLEALCAATKMTETFVWNLIDKFEEQDVWEIPAVKDPYATRRGHLLDESLYGGAKAKTSTPTATVNGPMIPVKVVKATAMQKQGYLHLQIQCSQQSHYITKDIVEGHFSKAHAVNKGIPTASMAKSGTKGYFKLLIKADGLYSSGAEKKKILPLINGSIS